MLRETARAGLVLLVMIAFALMIVKGPQGALAERITEVATQGVVASQ